MTFKLDTSLHWTDHFVEHGFAVLKGLVDTTYCKEAIERVKELFDDPRPLDQWTVEKPGIHHESFRGDRSDPILRKVFDLPDLRAAVATMHGGPEHWNNRETFYIFVKPYDPDAKAALSDKGHIDFGEKHIPILYRGCAIFLALTDTEPFSGNTMLWPGTHRIIQKKLIEEPTTQQPSAFFEELNANKSVPYEFVAQAGDVMFMHHLTLHAGNNSHSANHKPRVALLADAWRDQWLTEVDPATPNLPPWQRSLALNGAYKTIYDERAERAKTDPEVRAEIAEETAAIAAKSGGS
tara:strand:- start:675 stop:1556 length:882 start_codon:yes stop_codon:yes gene_type:complete